MKVTFVSIKVLVSEVNTNKISVQIDLLVAVQLMIILKKISFRSVWETKTTFSSFIIRKHLATITA